MNAACEPIAKAVARTSTRERMLRRLLSIRNRCSGQTLRIGAVLVNFVNEKRRKQKLFTYNI